MEQQSIGAMFKIISETIGKKVNADFKELNLTMQQVKILHFIKMREGKEETSQKDIQDFMKLSHPTVTNMLRLLKEKDFIEISTSSEDKRMRMVTLTGKEECYLKQIIKYRNETDELIVKDMSAKEQEELRKYLLRIYRNITEGSSGKE